MEEEADYYSWHEQFYYFTLFRALNGPDATPGRDCTTPIDDNTYYTQSNLSAWIRQQNHSRKLFLDGKVSDISANQIKVLDSVSFPWIRDSSERWDSHFQELIAYKQEHGHCNVPRRSGKLGIWVKNQRAAYHKLDDIANGHVVDTNVKKTTAVITQDQIKALTELGFQWKIREAHSDVWDTHFGNLKAFKEEHGHCNPTPQDHPVLGRWAYDMRLRYKKKMAGENQKGSKSAGNITDDQITRLEGIGFVWGKKGASESAEDKKRRLEESRKKKNERRKRQRMEIRQKKQEEKQKMEQVATVAALRTLDNSKRKKQRTLKSPVRLAANANDVADQIKNLDKMKNDLQKRLASLKEMEKERVKKVFSNNNKDIEKSVDQIKDDIDKKLAAGLDKVDDNEGCA